MSFFNAAGVCCVSPDGGFSPQLQGDGRDLRGVLERNRGQSRSQCIGRIGEWPPWSHPGWGEGGAAPGSHSNPSSLLPGLCFRPEEMTLVLGSHGPTLNVYIAKTTVCPCLSTPTAVAPPRGRGLPSQPPPIGTHKDHTFCHT